MYSHCVFSSFSKHLLTVCVGVFCLHKCHIYMCGWSPWRSEERRITQAALYVARAWGPAQLQSICHVMFCELRCHPESHHSSQLQHHLMNFYKCFHWVPQVPLRMQSASSPVGSTLRPLGSKSLLLLYPPETNTCVFTSCWKWINSPSTFGSGFSYLAKHHWDLSTLCQYHLF